VIRTRIEFFQPARGSLARAINTQATLTSSANRSAMIAFLACRR
jgi:hypothetical protein